MNVRTSSYEPDPEADAVALITLSGSPQLTPRNKQMLQHEFNLVMLSGCLQLADLKTDAVA